MKLYGLTGNIGCGKSTVAKLLVIRGGVVVFDCDRIAKDIMMQKTVKGVIVDIVGTEILADNGLIDWKKMAGIVFSDIQRKIELEHFVHPLVQEYIAREAEYLAKDTIGIVESAIIYENCWQDAFNGIIVAVCNKYEQMRRLTEVRLVGKLDAQLRINSQLPQWHKEQRADFVISTDYQPLQLDTEVAKLYQKLKQFKGRE